MRQFGSYSTVATDTSATFTDNAADGIQSGKCYRFQFTVYDHVGNSRTYTSADVKVDTTAPTTPSLTITPVTGTGVRVRLRHADLLQPERLQLGLVQRRRLRRVGERRRLGDHEGELPRVLRLYGRRRRVAPTPWRGTYSWTNASTTSPGAQTVTETNNATGTSTAGFTVTKDAAAPSTTDNTARSATPGGTRTRR